VVPGEGLRPLWWTPKKPVTEEQKRMIIESVESVDRAHSAFWGWHLCDEPGTVLYPKVKAIHDLVRSVDDSRPIFVNLHPGSDFAEYVKAVGPDVIAWDHYPIFDDGWPRERSIPPGFEHSCFTVDLAKARRVSLETGLPYLATMLSCGHKLEYEVDGNQYRRDYGRMTEARIRWQAYSALAYNAGGIGWFVYFPSESEDYEEGPIGRDWKPTPIYGWLQRVNREAGTIGAMLRGVTSVGAYESKPFYTWKGLAHEHYTPFPGEGFVTGVEGGLVSVGEFEDAEGAKYLIIVNRNVNEAIEVTPRVDWGNVVTVEMFDTGTCRFPEQSTWRKGEASLRLKLAPGNGVFLRFRLAGR